MTNAVLIVLGAIVVAGVLIVGIVVMRGSGSGSGVGGVGPRGGRRDDEERVPLAELPVAVTDAVERAVPGLVLEKAERETKRGRVVYEIEGRVGGAGGAEYEVEVTETGDVLDVDRDDD